MQDFNLPSVWPDKICQAKQPEALQDFSLIKIAIAYIAYFAENQNQAKSQQNRALNSKQQTAKPYLEPIDDLSNFWNL